MTSFVLRRPRCRNRVQLGAFSLAELLIAITIFAIVAALVMQLLNQTTQVWRGSIVKIQAFQEARAGFESLTRNLAQATLNTYYDYYQNSTPRSQLTGTALANFSPTSYDRVSDLHFVSGQAVTLLKSSPQKVFTQTQAVFFPAALGYSVTQKKLDCALNACGYFLQFGDEATTVPDHVKITPGYKPRYRFRLMEMTQPTENLGIYYNASATPVPGSNDWFTKYAATVSRPIAENVIALVLLPRLPATEDDPGQAGKGVSIAPYYNYNSRIPMGATADPAWTGASPQFPPDSFTMYPQGDAAIQATRHCQLPPLMRVVMVVLDETSAIALQGSSATVPPAIDFSSTTLFTDAAKLEEDLAKVEDICNARSGNLTGNRLRLNYRIFSTDIIMREAKWSNK